MKPWLLVIIGYLLLGIVAIHWPLKEFGVGLTLTGQASTASWVGLPIVATSLAMICAFFSWQQTHKTRYVLLPLQIGLVLMCYYSFRTIHTFIYRRYVVSGEFPPGAELIGLPFFILFLMVIANIWIKKKFDGMK